MIAVFALTEKLERDNYVYSTILNSLHTKSIES